MSRGPLDVLRAELESLPVMAAMASVNGVKCDSSEAEANLAQAIAQVEALVRVATESERLMRHAARCDRVELGPADELREALAPFTPGQDSEGGGHG